MANFLYYCIKWQSIAYNRLKSPTIKHYLMVNYEHAKALAFHSLHKMSEKIIKSIESNGETEQTKENTFLLENLINFFLLKVEIDNLQKDKLQEINTRKEKFYNKEEFRNKHNTQVKNTYL